MVNVLRITLIFIGFCLPVSLSFAHGLTITTATVMIRNQTHLTLRLNYDPILLLTKINSEERQTISLPLLANMPDDLFEKQYQSIKSLITSELSMQFDNKPVRSVNFRFPTTLQFRKSIREKFMRDEIDRQNKNKKQPIPHEDQHFYQTIEVDGFIEKGNTTGVLDIQFPAKLGEIMVSFSQPKMQTIKPGPKKTFYSQNVNLTN